MAAAADNNICLSLHLITASRIRPSMAGGGVIRVVIYHSATSYQVVFRLWKVGERAETSAVCCLLVCTAREREDIKCSDHRIDGKRVVGMKLRV